MKRFLIQLKTLNEQYIDFKNKSHTLRGKEKKFQNFIKKALNKLNEPYINNDSSLKMNRSNCLNSQINEISFQNTDSFTNYFLNRSNHQSKNEFETKANLEKVKNFNLRLVN